MSSTKHRVKVHLTYIGTGATLADTGTPYKWVGVCSCGWRCMSWEWQREDGSGALRISDQHARTGEL